MRKWMQWFGFFSAVAAASAPAAFAQGAAPMGLTPLEWGTISITAANWPDFIALKKGMLAKDKLEVDRAIISPQAITAAMIGGSIQIGFIGATQMIAADDAGADIVAIGQGMDPAPYFLISVPPVKTLADLKGKTVVMNNRTNVYTEAAKVILRKAGLDPERDVDFTYGPSSNERVAALTNGAVQAGFLVPPEDLPMVEKGYHRLAFVPDYFPKLALSLMAVRRDWADKNADVVRRFLAARAEAIQWLYEPGNKKEAQQILMDETHSGEAAAGESYDILVAKMHLFPNNGCIETEGLVKVEEMMQQLKQLKGNPLPATKLASTEWCPA